MLKITSKGRLIDTKRKIPPFIEIVNANWVFKDQAVTFLSCKGVSLDHELASKVSRSGQVSFHLGFTSLLKLDECLSVLPATKYVVISPLEKLVDISEIKNLYGIALEWHRVSGANFIFILENPNKYYGI